MDILYYSNMCKHSQKVVQFVVSNQLTDQLSCICVDKRKRDANNNQTMVILENGKTVMLPPNLQSIPAVLCVKRNYTLVLGTDPIIEYLQEKFSTKYTNMQFENPHNPTNNQRAQQRDPMGMTLDGLTMNSNIRSEPYTSYSMTTDDLSAKSTSQNRPLHHYTSVHDEFSIPTPEDTYRPDKVSSNVTIDVLQQQRNVEVPVVQVAPPQGLYGGQGGFQPPTTNSGTQSVHMSLGGTMVPPQGHEIPNFAGGL